MRSDGREVTAGSQSSRRSSFCWDFHRVQLARARNQANANLRLQPKWDSSHESGGVAPGFITAPWQEVPTAVHRRVQEQRKRKHLEFLSSGQNAGSLVLLTAGRRICIHLNGNGSDGCGSATAPWFVTACWVAPLIKTPVLIEPWR